MSTAPRLRCIINFSTGPSFSPVLVLDSVQTPLGTGALGDAGSSPVTADVSDQIQRVSIRRTYSRVSDTFNPGTATIRIADTMGYWNPDNPASPYYGLIQPMRKVVLSGSYGGVEYGLFAGYIQSYKYTAPNGYDVGIMEMQAIDGFGLLNLAIISTVAGTTAGQLPGARIAAILDAVSWPAALRNITTGATTCQADPGTARGALQAIQTVEETEYGAFFMDEFGNATFLDRTAILQAGAQTPTLFTDTGAGITYQAVDFAFDDKQMVNVATVQRTGGTAQTATDTTSVTNYFRHSTSRSNLLMETDTEALNQAQAIVATRANSTLRIDSMTLDISDDQQPARVVAALDLDYMDPITVTRSAPDASITKTLQILGVSHDVTPNRWVTTFQTVETLVPGFVLNSSYLGVLNTSSLGY